MCNSVLVRCLRLMVTCCCALMPATVVAGVASFDDLLLAPESFYNGADLAGGFGSGGAQFNNEFTDFGGGFVAWSGWSYSNVTDNVTPGFGNQYSAIAGGGSGSSHYGVAFNFAVGAATVKLPAGQTPVSMDITNTTYAYFAMLNGDSFSKKFGGASGNDEDYLLLTIEGLDGVGDSVGLVDVYLADYRFADNSLDYIIDEWLTVDLGGLVGATSLRFDMTGSDMGPFGLNTPTYFAADNIRFVPEPGSLVLLAVIGLVARRVRR